MRTVIIATFIVALLAVLSATAQALVGSSPDLNATLLYYEPVPASPGTILDVYVQLENSGDTARNVAVRFIDNSPFSLDTESDRVKTVNSIPAGESFLLRYKVRVSKDAVPGTSYLKLEWSVGSDASTRNKFLPVEISTSTVSLGLDNVRLDPEVFIPGQTGVLRFGLYNNAPLRIASGTVTLNLAELDIVPVGSSNLQRFTDLDEGAVREFTFQLAPSPSITPGIYKIPVSMTYKDQRGNTFTQEEYIGVRVGSIPAVSLTLDDTQVMNNGDAGDVIIRVTNKGLGEIKFATVYLQPSESYTIVSGGEERYVGNIDSDDYKTARISLSANADSVAIPVRITYMDALNKEYSATQTLTFTPKKTKSSMSSPLFIIIALVVIGGVAFFFLRRKKRK